MAALCCRILLVIRVLCKPGKKLVISYPGEKARYSFLIPKARYSFLIPTWRGGPAAPVSNFRFLFLSREHTHSNGDRTGYGRRLSFRRPNVQRAQNAAIRHSDGKPRPLSHKICEANPRSFHQHYMRAIYRAISTDQFTRNHRANRPLKSHRRPYSC